MHFNRLISTSLMILALAGIGNQAHAAPPDFSVGAAQNSIAVGGTTTLTFVIDNSGEPEISNVGFSMAFPAAPGQVVVADGFASTTCVGATVTAPNGATSIVFADDLIERNTICSVTVNVTLPVVGTYTFPAVPLAPSVGSPPVTSTTSAFNIAATAPSSLLDFDLLLSEGTILEGETTTATYVFTNISPTARVGGFNFSHTLPADIVIATPSNASSTCATGSGLPPSITANDGAQEIVFNQFGFNNNDFSAALLVGESCTFSVDLSGFTAGAYPLSPNPLTVDSQSVAGPTRTLVVEKFAAPTDEVTIAKSFSTGTVAPGATVDLTFNLGNANGTGAATNVSFTDDLDAFLAGSVVTGLPASDVCGPGSVVSGTSTLSLTGGSIPARGACSFTVTVQIPGAAAAGTYVNTTSAVQAQIGGGALGGTDTATASLEVTGGVPLVFSRAFTPSSVSAGGPLALTYTITNPAGNPAATDIEFIEDFSSVFGNLPFFTGIDGNCGASSVGVPLFDDSDIIGFELRSGELAPGDSCTFTATSTVPLASPGGTFAFSSSALTAVVGTETLTTGGQTDTLTINAGASATLAGAVEDTLDGANDGQVLDGGQFDVVLTITNSPESASGITAAGFTYDVSGFGAGTTALLQSNDCTGTATLNGTNEVLTVGGAEVSPGASCSVRLRVTAQGGQNQTETVTTSNLNFNVGGVAGQSSGAATSIRVNSVSPLVLTHSFNGGASALPGETVELRYTLENPNTSVVVSDIAFNHRLTSVLSGLRNAGVISDTCGFGVGGSSDFIIASSGSLPAGGTCDLRLNVTVPTNAPSGAVNSTIERLQANYGGAGVIFSSAPTSVLTVDTAPLDLSMSFAGDPVAPGEDVTVEFVIENPLGTAVNGLEFDLALNPSIGSPVFASSFVTNTCGGIDASSGTGTLTYRNGSLAANATCQISILASIPAGSNTGSFAHSTSELSATAGGFNVSAAAATDNLTIAASSGATFTASLSPTSVNVGGTTTITYTINNPGGGTIDQLAFSHDVSGSLQNAVATNLPLSDVCGAGSRISGTGTLSFARGALAAGESCSFSVDLAVPASATPSAVPYDTVTSGLQAGGLSVAAGAATALTISAAADLSVTKTDGVSSANAGDTLTYTIVASNAGPSADPNVTLSDTFPSGLTCSYTSVATGGATGNTASGTGDLAETLSLPASASVTYTASCLLDTALSGTLSNTATVTASVNDPDPSNNSATDNDTAVVQAADLDVTLFEASDPVSAGDNITYLLTVRNSGPSVAQNAQASFTLDRNLSLVSTSGCAEDPAGVTTCSLGTIVPGGSASFTVIAGGTSTISSDVQSSVQVSSDAVDPDLANNSAQETTSITQIADILTSLSDGLTSATAGSTINYTMDVTNAGPSTDPSVRIQAFFDSNTTCTPSVTFLNGGTPVSSTPVADGLDQTVSLPPSGRAFYNISCAIDAGFAGTLSQAVIANGSVIDPFPATNSAEDNDTVVSRSADLSITKTDGVSTVVSGEELTYTIVATNSGPSDEPSASVTDTFPSGLSCDYTSAASGGATGNTASGSGDLADTLSMPSGAAVTYTATCLVDPNATGTISNTATITGSATDPDPSNNSATDSDTAITPLTFGFAKSFSPSTVTVGETSRLTLVIDNASNDLAATSLAFNDPLPTGMVLAADPSADNTCGGTLSATAGASTVSLTGGTVAANASCSINVTVVTSQDGTLTNTTSVLTSSFPDADPAVADLSVNPAGAPGFTKAFTPSGIAQGETSTMTFTIDNTANLIEVTTLAFTDTFPSGMVVADSPDTANTCGGTLTATAGSAVVSLTDGTVSAGDTCEISVDVQALATGDLINTTSELTSSVATALAASATLSVAAPEAPGFAKSFSPDSIAQGETSILTFTIDNGANAVGADSIAFSDPFPDGLVLADAPAASNTCGGRLTATGGASSVSLDSGVLGAGASCEITVTVRGLAGGTLQNVTSTLTSTLATANAAQATLTVSAASAPGFAKAFSPSTVAQGETSTLTFTIDNSANAIEATDLAFVDGYPSGMETAETPNFSSTCGGAFTAEPGAGTVSLTGGEVAAGDSCTISVDVRAVGAGDLENTTSDLTSSLATAAAANATLTSTPASPPGLAKAFAPASIVVGETSVLTISIDNGANAIQAADLSLTDSFPAGMVVAPTPGLTNTCGGTADATAGAGSVTLTSGLVSEGERCEITVNVRAVATGSLVNVTGDLTSTLATADAATATLTVTDAGSPGFSMSFSPDSVVQGQETTLTFLIDNTGNAIEATSLAFTNTLPADVTVAATPGVSNTCGGTVTADSGASSLSFTGGTVAEGATCEVSIQVLASGSETVTNTASTLTSSLPTAAAASATLTVQGASAPGFTKVFGNTSLTSGETTTVTYTINNSANLIAATELAFTDTLPSVLRLVSSPQTSNSCGGTLAAASGTSSVGFSGGTLAPGATCVIVVVVEAVEAGSFSNTAPQLRSNLPTATAVLPDGDVTIVVAALPLTASMSYTPSTIEQGQTSTLTFTLSNPGQSAATAIALSNTLPSGVTLALSPAATNTCSGTLTALPGGTSLSLSGGTLAGASSCAISVSVTSQTVGSFSDTLETLSSSVGASATVSASLQVTAATTGTVTFVQLTDTDGGYVFSSTEPALNFTILAVGGSGQAGPIELAAGSYVVNQSVPQGVGNTSITCNDSDSSGNAFSRSITLNLTAQESVTCTISSISTEQKTVDVINQFLTKRADLILSSEPSSSRRFDRLRRGSGGASPLQFARGDLQSLLPFSAQMDLNAKSFSFGTSLLQIRQSAASRAVAFDTWTDTAFVDNYRTDIWIEAQYREFDLGSDGTGHFGVLYAGVDYLVTPDMLFGAMVQIDSMDDSSSANNSSASGVGWMIGPYVTARVRDALYFDGRIAVGQSRNKVSPFNTYTDEFDTSRLLIKASLSGEIERGNWTIRPNAGLSYYQETQDAYTDSLNVAIPSQTIKLGQLQIGPTFTGNFETISGTNYAPYFGLDAIYNYGDTSGVTLSDSEVTAAVKGLRGRIRAGVRIRNDRGARFNFGATYDGIGQSDYENWGVDFEVAIPLTKK